jgi:hypothetical protein
VSLPDAAAVVAERSRGMCEVCGQRPGVATHHRQPRQRGGVSGAGEHVNRVACLLRVCAVCHDWLETQERGVAYELGLLVRRPTDPATVPVWLATVNGEGWWLLHGDGSYEWQDGPEPVVLPGERARGRC